MSQTGKFIISNEKKERVFATEDCKNLSTLQGLTDYSLNLFKSAVEKMSDGFILIYISDFHCGYAKYSRNMNMNSICEVQQGELASKLNLSKKQLWNIAGFDPDFYTDLFETEDEMYEFLNSNQ